MRKNGHADYILVLNTAFPVHKCDMAHSPTDLACSMLAVAWPGAAAGDPTPAGAATGAVRFPTATAHLAAAAWAPAPACTAAAKSAGASGNETDAAAPGASVTRWKPLHHAMGHRCPAFCHMHCQVPNALMSWSPPAARSHFSASEAVVCQQHPGSMKTRTQGSNGRIQRSLGKRVKDRFFSQICRPESQGCQYLRDRRGRSKPAASGALG